MGPGVLFSCFDTFTAPLSQLSSTDVSMEKLITHGSLDEKFCSCYGRLVKSAVILVFRPTRPFQPMSSSKKENSWMQSMYSLDLFVDFS